MGVAICKPFMLCGVFSCYGKVSDDHIEGAYGYFMTKCFVVRKLLIYL